MPAELPLDVATSPETIWFAPRCCVTVRGDRRDVYAGGVLLGGFGQRDVAQRNVLLVTLAEQSDVHLGELSRAFGLSQDAVRILRRVYETRGLDGIIHRQRGGARSEVSPTVVRRLEKMFDQGLSVSEAFEKIGSAGKSRSTVGRVRAAWAARKKGSASLGEPEPPKAASPSAASDDSTPPEPAPSAVTPVALTVPEPELEEKELRPVQPFSASHVQHLGTWLLIAAVHSLGLHARAVAVCGGRVRAEALRLALDSVVATLAIGERCVEGVRRLATATASALLLAARAPSPTWTRRTFGEFSERNGGALLQISMSGVYLARAKEDAGREGPVFYADNHLRKYTGRQVLRHGWRMQDKRARPGTTDYYVHDEDGRVIRHVVAPQHGALTDFLTPICRLLRLGLGDKVRILVAFDRAGSFPAQMAELRDEDFEFVTYERRPYALLAESEFTDTVLIDGERYGLHESRANLGGGRGRVRRISVRTPEGHQVNLMAVSRRPAWRLLEVMLGRWVQENGFKHGNERWGLNQLDGRSVERYAPEAVIPNPARRRLDDAIELARVREGLERNELARLPEADPRRARCEAEVLAAAEEQRELIALRPVTPTHAPVADTELSGRLVFHKVEYKLALDTVRAACINAEADLALLLAQYLPRAAEAKKVLANLFAAPGDVTVRQRSIIATLAPAANAAERTAIKAFLAALDGAHLHVPGDQAQRPIQFRLAEIA